MPARDDVTVDIHAHVIVPAVTKLVADAFDPSLDPFLRFGGESTVVNERLAPELLPALIDPVRRLATMDRQGIDVQAVSIAPPQYHYWADPELGARIARLQNDAIAELVAAHPSRLCGLGSLPMQAPEAAVRELERVVQGLGLPGVSINPSAEGRDYDDPAYEPFWARVSALDAVVVLHPNGYRNGERLTDHYLINVVGNPMETTVALSHLVLGGVLERHPGLKIVAVHGGGYLPFYMDRMDHAWTCRPEIRDRLPRRPSDYLRAIWYDTVVHGAGLDALVALVGSDHVVLGTDYPYDMGIADPLDRIASIRTADAAQKRAIAGLTAARLLGLAEGSGSGPRPVSFDPMR